MNAKTTSEIRPESLQLVVGGLVTGMLWTSHTFAHATGEHFAVSLAHQPPDAPEPGSLVGEARSEAEALGKEIGKLETELCFLKATEPFVWQHKPLVECLVHSRQKRVCQERIETKRSELAALIKQMAHRKLPSPTNGPSSPIPAPRRTGETKS